MYRLLGFLLIWLAFTLKPARADWVLVQKVEGAMQTGNMTLKVKGTKTRTDVTPQLSTISDAANGETVTLMHEKKQFMRLPAERTRALLEKRLNPDGPSEAPAKPVATGKTEQVESYACEVYTWTNKRISASYWVAKEFPNYPALKAALEVSQNNPMGELARLLAPQPSDFPGMIVKTEMTIADQKVTTTLISAKEDPVDANLFNIPKNYTELPTPEFAPPAAAKK